MRDPNLTADEFLRDEVLLRETIHNARDFARCSGAVVSDDAVRFVSDSRLTIKLCPENTDLSKYDRLSLKVFSRSKGVVLVGVTLRYGPEEEPPSAQPVFLSGGRESLPDACWEDVHFPLESFGTYGSPKGWDDIREIEFSFSRERTHVGLSEIDVSIAGLYGEVRRIPDGRPRLTLRGLDAVLSATPRSVVTSPRGFVFEQADAEHSSGKNALEPYTDNAIRFPIPPPHSYPPDSVEEILAGRIMGYSTGLPIEWDSDPMGMLEWTHFLHRHHFVHKLVEAVASTDNPDYVRALDSLIRDWILSNPVPVGSNGGAGPAWETLSVAWRLREWLWVIGIGWQRKDFSQETKISMLRSIWEHARSLMDHQGHPNNWMIVESAALALAGICFPEFLEAEAWFDTGMERLQKEFHRQFFRDGVHFEISPFYHAICLHALLEVKQVASARGIKLPSEFGSPLEKTTEYLASLCRPNFTWPSLNDSQGVSGDYSPLMRLAGRIFNRPDLAWFGSGGCEGKPPKNTGSLFPAAGICTMRSHYGKDANFAVFRAGPAGAAHVHWDTLSLDVTALGLPRLVDPGITSYAPGNLTDHYRSAAAHNTILINGKGMDQSGIDYHEKVNPADETILHSLKDDLEIVSGVCKGPWTGVGQCCVVFRTVMFIKKEYWLVRDVISGTGSLDVTTCWQFSPGLVEINHKTCVARFIDARGPGLLVIPLLGSLQFFMEIATGLTVPPRGWISAHGMDLPATSCRYTAEISNPATLSWLLIPVFGKAADTVTAERQDEDGIVRLKIAFEGSHTDLISWQPPVIDPKEHFPAAFHEGIHFSRTKSRNV